MPSSDDMEYINATAFCIYEYSTIPNFAMHDRDSFNVLTIICHPRNLGVYFFQLNLQTYY